MRRAKVSKFQESFLFETAPAASAAVLIEEEPTPLVIAEPLAPEAALEPKPDEPVVTDDVEVMASDDSQQALFVAGEWWEHAWKGMPEFIQEDLTPLHSIKVTFETDADAKVFEERLGQKIPNYSKRTPFIWFPEAEIGHFSDRRYVSKTPLVPRHPIYIVSKGRWETRLTSKALTRLGVKHHIVVEASELDKYAAVAGSLATLLVLDPNYQEEYDACDEFGMTKSKGSGAARNFAWDHAASSGARWHWLMDDNIDGFYRLNKNLKTPIGDATILRVMEDFVERYANVSMAGPNYFMFASRKSKVPPLTLNTRIYSCNLIKNDVPYRWRCRFNEDTDLSLRMLKDGFATILFNAFLQMKATTQTLAGGNTELYKSEGTLAKSEMLVRLHPDVSKIAWRFGRWHHFVDYSSFKRNTLILKDEAFFPNYPDDYGMSLQIDEEKKWER